MINVAYMTELAPYGWLMFQDYAQVCFCGKMPGNDRNFDDDDMNHAIILGTARN
jgi:hypothetical protein